MRDLNDDNIDTLLREHLAAELDGQLDRARHTQPDGAREHTHPDTERCRELDRAPAVFARSSRRLPWRAVAAGLPAALAAGIALVFALPALFQRTGTSDPTVAPVPTVAQNTVRDTSVKHEVEWNTIDQGTVFVNGDVPMRSIRRQRVDSLRWFDPASNATLQLSVPDDEVVLIGMHAN